MSVVRLFLLGLALADQRAPLLARLSGHHHTLGLRVAQSFLLGFYGFGVLAGQGGFGGFSSGRHGEFAFGCFGLWFRAGSRSGH